MDLELATGVLGALPELGGLSGMVVFLVLLLRWQGQTTTRHGEEMDRMARLHDAEVAELRAENATVREQRDAAEARLRDQLGPPRPAWTPSPVLDVPGPSTGPLPVSPRPGRRRRDP